MLNRSCFFPKRVGLLLVIAVALTPIFSQFGVQAVQAQTACTTPSFPPALCVQDTSVVEGQRALFTLTLSRATQNRVDIAFTTNSGSATSGVDFTPHVDTFSIPPGTASLQIHVDTIEDTAAEGDETFTLTILTATNVTIARGTATGTITDNDGTPPPAPITVSVDDDVATEGDATVGPRLEFDVKLSRPPVAGEVINVDFQTVENTAKAGQDYISKIGTLRFDGNDPNVRSTQPVFVQIVGDRIPESPKTETFFFRLTDARGGATITDNEGVGTIVDDDSVPVVTINRGGRILEGNSGARAEIFTLTLTDGNGHYVGSPYDALTVQYSTAGQSATGGASCTNGIDFVETTSTIVFDRNEFQRSFKIDVCGDTRVEPDETVAVVISTNQATIGRGQANVTIVNDDTTPPPAPKPVNKGSIGANGVGVRVTGQLVAPGLASNEALFKTKAGQFVSNIGRTSLVGTSNIISNDGASLVTDNGSGIIGNDGASLITNDGGSLITNDGGSLISNDGAGIISNDGASLITNDGGS